MTIKEREVAILNDDVSPNTYSFPPVSILKSSQNDADPNSTDDLKTSSRRINEVLRYSNVDAHIISVCVGPLSIRYEIELSLGVRLAELRNLSPDIALILGCEEVTIAPVAGKCSVVGIDAPRKSAAIVYLRDVMETHEFMGNQSSLAFALGKDATGHNIICDLNKEGHLLIGGTTGTGKSTMMHALIISLLYHLSPDDVRFVMVDTSGLELSQYNGIPHLIAPVTTDTRRALHLLQWLHTEMQRRYKVFREFQFNSIDAYNRQCSEYRLPTLPSIVAFADDLFKLFPAGDDLFEESIHNIILMGHTVGIHLVMATQFVNTGKIAELTNLRNMGRIGFALPSKLESISLLGRDGSEQLSGEGEMLYNPVGSSILQHIQGCFVSQSEIESVVDYIRDNVCGSIPSEQMDIHNSAVQESEAAAVGTLTSEEADYERDEDELFNTAVNIVLETGEASVSKLQRQLKLGYARAARIIDKMEENGIVAPFQGLCRRKILITREQWESRRNYL